MYLFIYKHNCVIAPCLEPKSHVHKLSCNTPSTILTKPSMGYMCIS